MKTNFSTKRVSGNVSFSFDDMALITDLFETAALEAIENDEAGKIVQLGEIADKLGFEMDVDWDFTPAAPLDPESQAGQESETTE